MYSWLPILLFAALVCTVGAVPGHPIKMVTLVVTEQVIAPDCFPRITV